MKNYEKFGLEKKTAILKNQLKTKFTDPKLYQILWCCL